MKKRMFVLFVTMLFVAGTILGCGATAQENPETEATNGETENDAAESMEEDNGELEKATISVWYTAVEGDENDRDNLWMTKAIEEFGKLYPQITIEATVLAGPGGQDYRTKLRAEVAAGSVPDVFNMFSGGELEPYIVQGAAKDVTDIVAEDPYLSSVVDLDLQRNNMADGRLYMVGQTFDMLGLFYNKQLFAENNLEVPETIDDLYEVAEVFKGKGITPVALGDSVGWTLGIPYAMLYAENIGYEEYKSQSEAKELDFTSQEAKAALTTLNEIISADVFTKDYAAINPAEARAQFANGEAAMFLQGSWQASSLNEEMGENVGYIAFPTQFPETNFDCGYFGKGFCLGNNSDDAEGRAAVAFWKFLSSEQMIREMVKLSSIVAYRNVNLDGIEMVPIQSDMIEAFNNTDHMIEQLETFMPVSVQTEYRNTLSTSAANGDVSALDSLQEYIESMK